MFPSWQLHTLHGCLSIDGPVHSFLTPRCFYVAYVAKNLGLIQSMLDFVFIADMQPELDAPIALLTCAQTADNRASMPGYHGKNS